MANQPIRGREAHTTNLADSTYDDDLFSFIFKKSHENRWLFLIKNVQKWLLIHTFYIQFDACLENSKDGRIDVFQNIVWLLKDPVKWTSKQPG